MTLLPGGEQGAAGHGERGTYLLFCTFPYRLNLAQGAQLACPTDQWGSFKYENSLYYCQLIIQDGHPKAKAVQVTKVCALHRGVTHPDPQKRIPGSPLTREAGA